MESGTKVEIRPQRDIVTNTYSYDEEEQFAKIDGQSIITVPEIIPGYGEVIIGTIIRRQTWGPEIKKNRWLYGAEWVVVFEGETLERIFQPSEITVIE